jgi:hypothetical protein
MSKHKVANKIFSFQSLFIINSYIEIEGSINSKFPICKDTIFLEFYKGYERNNTKISMTINSFELRMLSYACRELFKTGKTNFINYTDPQLSKNTSSAGRKELSLGFDSKNYFLNLSQNNSDKRKAIFNKYGILSFADIIENIANETETMLYKCQRQLEKKVTSEQN